MVLRGGPGGMTTSPALLVARRSPASKNKIKIGKKIFDFKQKKKTRRKGINASQLAIRNFNDVTEKHMNILFLRGFP